MILYRKVVASQGKDRLELILDQLGAPSKPYYFCILESKQEGRITPSAPTITFFLEQHKDATEAIEAITQLAARLMSYPDLEPCVNLARVLSTQCQWESEWGKVKRLLKG